jgi:hypothetical protein
MLMREAAAFDLALRVRQGVATIGEIYTFVSGLYFRGKMAYAEAFRAAPPEVPSALVIVPGVGLIPPETIFSVDQLNAIAEVAVHEDNHIYRDALLSAAKSLDQSAGPVCSYVLLGSVASGKYTEPLLKIFDERLLFPSDFVGRGDMSRGGLMLRRAFSGVELPYIPVQGAIRHGARPPKLERWRQPR